MDLKTLREQTYIADEYLEGDPKAVVIWLHGLGYCEYRTEPSTPMVEWARRGALVILPWYGPWSWMNRQARQFVDDVVDAAFDIYRLPAATPVITTGGSMGGLSTLLHARYARHPVVACSAACPPCDLPYSFHERPDIPRTVRHAFRGYPEPLEEVLLEHSPLHQVPGMPDIPYQVIHGGADTAVAKAHHSDPFVAAMRKAGRRVEYIEIPKMTHNGDAMPLDAIRRRIDFVSSFIPK